MARRIFISEKQKEQKPALRLVGNGLFSDPNSHFELEGEQQPAEKQDYSGLNDLEGAIHRGFLSAGVENVPVAIIKETAKECLAQMKPAEWSVGIKEALDKISDYLKYKGREEDADFIRHLRQQPHWKPSEEQMKALRLAYEDAFECPEGCVPHMPLKSLLSDLQKLL